VPEEHRSGEQSVSEIFEGLTEKLGRAPRLHEVIDLMGYDRRIVAGYLGCYARVLGW
jgi:hypothetical protein